MSLQKAIDEVISHLMKLREETKVIPYAKELLAETIHNLEIVTVNFFPPQSYEPSPDTQYKKSLTKWIEAKHQAENPYSIFEAWQKKGWNIHPLDHEEGEG